MKKRLDTTEERLMAEETFFAAFDNKEMAVKFIFSGLTDDERREIMSLYCYSCGCDDPGCECWNDD